VLYSHYNEKFLNSFNIAGEGRDCIGWDKKSR